MGIGFRYTFLEKRNVKKLIKFIVEGYGMFCWGAPLRKIRNLSYGNVRYEKMHCLCFMKFFNRESELQLLAEMKLASLDLANVINEPL